MKKICAMVAAAVIAASPMDADAAKKVHTIGDSTMANYDESATVTRGWCQYLQQFLDGIEVNNRGKSGASSKSFYQEAAFWASVKKQLQPGDYVVIQFAHNDEKNAGMDGDEVKAYYTSIGDTEKAAATDYRGTTPTTTYREYLKKYVDETREAGCTPILCGPICRMYFSGNTIRRNGRHDLGDNFSKVTPDGILENQSVSADDHTMDYVWQMKSVAEEMNVPFIDLTTATADLYLSYGDTPCHDLLGDGAGSTHLSATGAALIARRFAGLLQQAGLLKEYVNLTSELSILPSNADLGEGYKGQVLTKEFILTGFDLTPSKGEVSITASGNLFVSTDKTSWAQTATIGYDAGTLIDRFYAKIALDKEGVNEETIIVKAGDKTLTIPVTAKAVELGGGTEVCAYWRLEKDDSYTLTGPATVIPESWSGMYVQRYANPNANTFWPEETGFDASRKTQRNLITGDVWPDGEIDEVSTRYIEFGLTAMPETTLKIDEISYYMCGCGGNGMCVHVYYSTDDDFANPQLIYSKEKMPANTMLDGKVTPVITLEGGKSVRLRFYPWYNGSANGKTICLSDIKIHGYAFSEGSSSLAGTPLNQEVTATTYFNLQGMRVEHPSSGLYISKNVYDDGSVEIKKIIL